MKTNDCYLYDEILGEKWKDYDGNEHGFTPNDLADSLRDLEEGDTMNLYVNSPGGSVFSAVAMTSEIRRVRQKGVKVNAFVDGIAASAASFLIMACDTVYMYQGSMLMVHKPMSFCIGNADDMLKAAEELESIQDGTCMPLYRSKLKGDVEELSAMIANETWLSATKSAEIFEIEIVEGLKEVKSVMTEDLIAKYGYRHTPENLVKAPEAEAPKEPKVTEGAPEPVDYTEYKERIARLGGAK